LRALGSANGDGGLEGQWALRAVPGLLADWRQIVKEMVANGVPQEHIARVLGIAAKTLRKHCKTEIAIGKTIANFRVADALFKMATDPNGGAVSVAAAKFFLKARAGWKE
jgi:hypothetical protein